MARCFAGFASASEGCLWHARMQRMWMIIVEHHAGNCSQESVAWSETIWKEEQGNLENGGYLCSAVLGKRSTGLHCCTGVFSLGHAWKAQVIPLSRAGHRAYMPIKQRRRGRTGEWCSRALEPSLEGKMTVAELQSLLVNRNFLGVPLMATQRRSLFLALPALLWFLSPFSMATTANSLWPRRRHKCQFCMGKPSPSQL